MEDLTQTKLNNPPDIVAATDGPELKSWGPFQILSKVGQGGFGAVYRALDTTLEREVALKLLLPRGQSTEAATNALIREARLMAKVRHSNVVPVYGVDTHDGRVGLWSDFVRGRTLSTLLEVQGPYGAKEAANIGIDLARAVGAVHAAGLIHRDIKTGNVMREEGGRILLMDFGLSEARGESGLWAGTPNYMAPELFLGQPATAASDIYAIGVVLFHLLTSQYPYQQTSMTESSAAPRLHLLDARPDLPESLARVVEKATAPNPAHRYASAGELIAALAPEAGSGAAPIAAVANAPMRRTWLFAPAAVALLAAGFLAAGGYWISIRSAPPGAPSPVPAQQAHQLLAHYYKANNTADAITLLERIEEPKRTASHWADLSRAYFLHYRQLRDPKLKEPVLQAAARAKALNANLASPYVTLAMLHAMTDENDSARDELDQALKLDALDAEAYMAQGELLFKQGHKNKAESAFKKAVDLDPTDWRFADQLAYYYERTGDRASELKYYQESVANAKDNPRAFNNLGLSYWRAGRLEEAKAAFQDAIRLDPGPNPSAANRYLNMAIVLKEEGKYEESVEQFRKAIAMAPTGYLMQGGLGFVYRLMPGQAAEAKRAFKRAIEIAESLREQQKRNPGLLVNLGDYYAALGNESKAEAFLRQAAVTAPEDPEVLYRTGLGYELLNRREEAIQWIQKSLEHGQSIKYLELQPELKGLRADRRFLTVRKQITVEEKETKK